MDADLAALHARLLQLIKPQVIDALQDAADGLTIDQSAAKRSYSTRAIKNQRSRGMLLLGANNTPHAVAEALRYGVIK